VNEDVLMVRGERIAGYQMISVNKMRCLTSQGKLE
jgi:hypothetical protein